MNNGCHCPLHSMGLLGEFLEVLNQCFSQTEDDSEAVVELLTELSRSSRFGLAMTFLGSSEKKAVSFHTPPLSSSADMHT